MFGGEQAFSAWMRGYKPAMDEDKLQRDRRGEIFQDELTENESMPSPASREVPSETLEMDPGVDSQEGDEAMAENRFGLNQKRPDDKQ
jgi:hypothetical protein